MAAATQQKESHPPFPPRETVTVSCGCLPYRWKRKRRGPPPQEGEGEDGTGSPRSMASSGGTGGTGSRRMRRSWSRWRVSSKNKKEDEEEKFVGDASADGDGEAFADAAEGSVGGDEWRFNLGDHCGGGGGEPDEDGMWFFDAVSEELGPEDYPPAFTDRLRRAPRVTLDEPETLLYGGGGGMDVEGGVEEHKDEEAYDDHPIDRREPSGDYERFKSEAPPVGREPIDSHARGPSARFDRLARRPTMEVVGMIESPRVPDTDRGFPGALTAEELEECRLFLRRLKVMDAGVAEQVYSMRDVEDEPYTICRWLRAMKFDHAAILDRCEENQAMFDAAKASDFYPDVGEAIGAPFSVFLSQYPFLPIGNGMNGCPVNYFQVGKMQPEGLMALTTTERLAPYFWWSFMHKFKEMLRKAHDADPDFVRIEGINVLDLEGLSASTVSQEALNVVKLSSKIADFFPETLHCMLILNAPGFFSFAWGVIKKCIDARTASRIKVFSSKSKGMKALRKIIAEDMIPFDYGGTNISIRDAFREEARDPDLIRQEVKLLHAGRKKTAVLQGDAGWELRDRAQVMEVSVYTRSVSSAEVAVCLDGEEVARVRARCRFGGPDERPAADGQGGGGGGDDGDDDQPKPQCFLVTEGLSGPGTVTVRVKDLDDADQQHSSHSRGYFLVVGNVKRAASVRKPLPP